MKTTRNTPCPCGSGKKFKHCCLADKASQLTSPIIHATQPAQADMDRLVALLNSGQYAHLEQQTHHLLRRCPNSGFGWKILGVALQIQGKNGLQALQKAAELLPQEAEAQDNLANALQEHKRLDESLVYYQKAITLKPDFAQAHSNMGRALHSLGRPSEAKASYQLAIQYNPLLAVAHENLGDILREAGQLDQAAQSYRTALQINPNLVECLNKLGVALSESSQSDEALLCYQKLISIQPNHAVALGNMGNLLRDKSQLAESLDCYKRALSIRPDFINAHINMGVTLQALKKYELAIAAYQEALRLKPDSAEAHNNLANTLRELQRLDESIDHYHMALAINPKLIEAHSNLGNSLDGLGRFDEAVKSCKIALQHDPEFLSAHINLAVAKLNLGDTETAQAHLEYVLTKQPDHETAGFNMAGIHLSMGRLNEGWKGYEHRFVEVPKRDFAPPTWAGEDLTGKTLLIWSEQGVGDEITFTSLYAKAIKQAQRTVIDCRAKLQPLFARSFPTAQVVAGSDPPHPASLTDIDYQCPAGSLGRWLCASTVQIPRLPQYLTPDPARLKHWRAQLADLGPGLKIGICWRSSMNKGSRAQQYSTLDQWHTLFALPGVQIINLQYDECAAELEQARKQFGLPIHAFTQIDMFNDLDETSALIGALDVVVGAATAVTAMSAAVGVPTCQMSFGQNWSTLGTQHDAFAANLHHFRRKPEQDWSEIIAQIAAQIQQHGVPAPNPPEPVC